MNEELKSGHFSSELDFCQRAKAAGYRWVTLEWNQWGNSARGDALRTACAQTGLVFTIWFTRSGQPENDMDFTTAEAVKAVIASKCAGFLGEAEVPAESDTNNANPAAQNWEELAYEMRDLPIFKGVVTNFAPFVHHNGTPWKEKADPLTAYGWHCISECYLPESINSTPENQDFFAKSALGWPETQPVVGVYSGVNGAYTLADYPTRGNYRNWSVWAAGNVL